MKKILSFILCAAMLLAMVPSVFAEDYTITSISAYYTEPLIENVDGYITTDALGREYFMYDVLYCGGLMITVTFSNGEEYTLPAYVFDDIDVRGDQGYTNPWGPGEHRVSIQCEGKKTTATVTVIENPVDYIEAEMQRPLIENVDGYETIDFDADYEDMFYFRYDIEYSEALYLTVHMKDGSVVEGILDDVYEMTGYMAEFFDDQSYLNQWGVGVHTATVRFMGATADFEVEITESDLASLVVTPSRDLIEGVDCSWEYSIDYETWEIIDRYPYYNAEDFLDVTITYDDGYSLDCKASEVYDLTGIPIHIYDDQGEYNVWSAGSHTVYGKYMGVEFEAVINIVENPFSAIKIYESENKELHLVFTEKNGGTVDCKAEKIAIQSDLDSVFSGDNAVKAVIVTDKGTYNVRLATVDENGDEEVKIFYGTLESNTLASCEWLNVTDLAYDIAGASVLYQITSTVELPDLFYGYNSNFFANSIDYLSYVCAFKYFSDKIASFDEGFENIVDISEDGTLISVIADVDELNAVAADLFGIKCDFAVLDSYDKATGTVKVPLMYPEHLTSGTAALLVVGDGGMDSCTYEDGKWTATVNYDYVDENGALQTACMTVIISSDMKVLSVDMGMICLAGDINGDNVVDMKDSNLIKRIMLGGYDPTSRQFAAADINGDGSVNTKDSYLIKQIILGE